LGGLLLKTYAVIAEWENQNLELSLSPRGREKMKFKKSDLDSLFKACRKDPKPPCEIEIPHQLAKKMKAEIGEEAFNEWLNDLGVTNQPRKRK
jgi:hypothetical protein